jgi:PAT family beta-lactamase induction signal transducer AmpG
LSVPSAEVAPPVAVERRRGGMAVMAAFGFFGGLPLPLTGITLQQWLTENHLSLGAIGLFANVGLAYSLKFLWAPLLDRAPLPGVLARFGRRRGWLLITQPLLALAIALLASCDPAQAVWPLVGAATAVAFLSATQDIAIDAWRIEAFPAALQGAALAVYVWGYRAALFVAGALALRFVGTLGWHGVILALAGLLALAPLVTLAAGIPAGERAVSGAWSMRATIWEPLREFLSRPGAVLVLAFVMLFKLGEVLAGRMATPFYNSLGYDRVQISNAIGIPGIAASLCGFAVGGWLVARIGVGRALIATGFVQMASMGLYFALAYSGGDPVILIAKVMLENFAETMADAAFLSFLSSLCAPGYSATQYALLSSLAVIPLRTVGGLSGFLAQAMGWIPFYGLTIFAAVPAMLIMLVLVRRGVGASVRA